jgi:hypothetical protein
LISFYLQYSKKAYQSTAKKSIVFNVAYPIPFIHISYSQKISHLCELIILTLFAELKDDKTHTDNSFEALNYYLSFYPIQTNLCGRLKSCQHKQQWFLTQRRLKWNIWNGCKNLFDMQLKSTPSLSKWTNQQSTNTLLKYR